MEKFIQTTIKLLGEGGEVKESEQKISLLTIGNSNRALLAEYNKCNRCALAGSVPNNSPNRFPGAVRPAQFFLLFKKQLNWI